MNPTQLQIKANSNKKHRNRPTITGEIVFIDPKDMYSTEFGCFVSSHFRHVSGKIPPFPAHALFYVDNKIGPMVHTGRLSFRQKYDIPIRSKNSSTVLNKIPPDFTQSGNFFP
ncbi:hypothetical protein SLA2020_400360 [Shorea laevis]